MSSNFTLLSNKLKHIPGKIKHFYTINPSLKEQGIKVPHMGWNSLEIDSTKQEEHVLFNGFQGGE